MFVSAKDKAADLPDGESGDLIEKVWRKYIYIFFEYIKLTLNTAFNTLLHSLQEREDVPVEVANGELGFQYYEQLHYNELWLKLGDCVYIRSHGLVRPRVGRWEK